MYVDYFFWQYVQAPQWLLRLLFTLHTALFRIFSVPFMIRTLFAPWRRDVVPYRGTLSQLGIEIAWNLISRVIGAIVRATLVITWLAAEILFLVVASLGFILFVFGPLVALVMIVGGIVLLLL